MSSVRIKDGLVILDPLCHRLDFLPRWLCRIARRGQHANLMMQSISKRRALVAVRLEPPMNGANPVAKPSVLPRPTITTGKPV